MRGGRPTPSRSNTPQPIRPAPNAPYHPQGESSTYRDLLLFEERLKSNAEMLRKRRRRYSVFLWSFVAALMVIAHRLLFHPPNTLFSLRALQASLAVVLITLILFFASGMYEEKIRYAHSYINHSNKALRPLNMHLNMRRPKLSLLSYIPIVSHYARSEHSPTPPITSNTTTSSLKPSSLSVLGKGVPPSPIGTGAGIGNGRRVSSISNVNVMATIPPSSNPRGELIFSSRVDRSFREGYERYRSAFERRREEKAREQLRSRGGASGLSLIDLIKRRGRKREDGYSPGSISVSEGTPTATPPLSRRSTPDPLPIPITNLQGGGSGGSRRSPSPASNLRHSLSSNSDSNAAGIGIGIDNDKESNNKISSRDRAESYSFVWTATAAEARAGGGNGIEREKGDKEVLRRAP